MYSVQFKWFIYAQITAHDVHYKFEVMSSDVSFYRSLEIFWIFFVDFFVGALSLVLCLLLITSTVVLDSLIINKFLSNFKLYEMCVILFSKLYESPDRDSFDYLLPNS